MYPTYTRIFLLPCCAGRPCDNKTIVQVDQREDVVNNIGMIRLTKLNAVVGHVPRIICQLLSLGAEILTSRQVQSDRGGTGENSEGSMALDF
jgi:hypothetical protein